jgi:hypothetical protein
MNLARTEGVKIGGLGVSYYDSLTAWALNVASIGWSVPTLKQRGLRVGDAPNANVVSLVFGWWRDRDQDRDSCVTPMPRLPQELVEEIIDHLSNDYSSLKSFSLVCTDFVPRCRSHLFGTCTLGPKNILAFHDLLRDPRGCTFLPHVRAIMAFRYSWHDNDHYFNTIAPDLRRLTSVRSLQMKLVIVVDDSNADSFFRTGFVTGFPHVTDLVLTCNFDGYDAAQPAPIVDMICMLPALQCLVVREMSDSAIVEPTAPALPPPALRILRLSAYSVGPILSWLHKCKHLPNVDSLSLPLLLRRDASIVRAALQQLGGALCHFEFVLTWVLDYSDGACAPSSPHRHLPYSTTHSRPAHRI